MRTILRPNLRLLYRPFPLYTYLRAILGISNKIIAFLLSDDVEHTHISLHRMPSSFRYTESRIWGIQRGTAHSNKNKKRCFPYKFLSLHRRQNLGNPKRYRTLKLEKKEMVASQVPFFTQKTEPGESKQAPHTQNRKVPLYLRRRLEYKRAHN